MVDRTERPVKRLSLGDDEDTEDADDWIAQKYPNGTQSITAPGIARPRRGQNTPTPTATINRTPAAPSEGRQSIRLTVKAPPSKLREATSSADVSAYPEVESRGDDAVRGPRSSRNRKPIVEDTTTEEEEDEDEEMEYEEAEDDEGPDDENEEDEDDEADEADEADEDAELDDGQPPPRPVITQVHGRPGVKPSVTVTPAAGGKVKSVEAKEMEMADEDDDEELSELESQDEEGPGGEDDAEGDDDVGDDLQGDGVDTDDETPVPGSRDATPDLSKLTRRQRGHYEDMAGGLMALSNEAQKKKHLTAEEHAMRRAEMARRRKNLSDKRNEEEKMDTINRLLKKQAPKRGRGRRDLALAADAGGESTPAAGEEMELVTERPKATMVRWVNNQEGSRIGVPEEWMGTPVGRVFEGSGFRERRDMKTSSRIRLIEEVA